MKQVIYDETGVIAQWQDTDLFSYPVPDNGCKVLVVTEQEWQLQATHKWVKNGKITNVPTVYDPIETMADQVRRQRDALLKKSDWTQVSDSPVDKEAWATYRQALRDISSQKGFPDNINWPAQP